jgi:hypothetical protein
MRTDLQAMFRALAVQKRAVLKREEKLVADLRGILGQLGYRLEPISTNGMSRPGPKSSRPRRTASRGSKPLTCSECGRTFALPLHLGRHMSVMHKRKNAPGAQSGSSANQNDSARAGAEAKPRRSHMSPAARRAAARRMKAYWRKRKAADQAQASASPRRGAARTKAGRSSRSKQGGRAQQRAA